MNAHLSELATLLEKARWLSAAHQSELVVCLNFLPWMDLAVSADAEADERPGPHASPAERRWQEAAGFLCEVNEAGVSRSSNWTALVSFGLLRGWHVDARARFTRAHGPIRLVLDGVSPRFKPPRFA